LDNGYKRRELWSEEGWEFIKEIAETLGLKIGSVKNGVP